MPDKVKFPHLLAWDLMMGSSESWRTRMQEEAEADGAPEDAIFKDSEGLWHRFADCKNPSTRSLIQALLDDPTRACYVPKPLATRE